MKILVFGDIYGRVGRKGFLKELDNLKNKYSPNFTIANIENITSGRGPIAEHAQCIRNSGVDVMTGGDHIYDNAESIGRYFREDDCRLIRPANFYESSENLGVGKGSIIVEKSGKRLLVVQLLGEVFMNHKVSNPFLCVDDIITSYPRDSYDAVIVDFHRETTAELYGMGHYLMGRVALVYGTHTHIQTNDARILGEGTAIITDVGMNGPYNSVIGADFSSVKKRFLSGIQKGKIEQSLENTFIINAVILELDPQTGKAQRIENISYYGTL